MLVSIIVPAYKQEKTIKRDIRRIYKTMRGTRWEFEIIVVVDGYLDNTLKLVKQLKLPNVHSVGYKTNRGKGYAVRYGMARARGDYVVFIDAGMDIDPNGISMVMEHMEWYDADIIVASKRHLASQVDYTLIRRLYSMGYFFLVRMLFGLKISDTQVGLKVFKRNVLKKVLPRLVVKEFAFDIELLAVAYKLGFKKIYPAPVKLNLGFDENSNFSSTLFLVFTRNIRRMLIDTIAVFYRMYILNYYSDKSRRIWVYDKELDMRVNTGKLDK